ncbi:MAG: hypothetical protein D6770_05020 [Anaerolineae bacterium]|nr:MAG: hypothetical protein D6770_05020 [Anaerolineae bacterium]
MVDELRDQASAFFEEEEEPDFLDEEAFPSPATSGARNILASLTPLQRFILALMLMLTVCLIGTMFLLVTQRFVLF